jgi:catechol 2,3-dioxygenase-like lactoylglutathione lyase family enzyme
MRPRIDAVHSVLGSRDVAASIRFYGQLGFVRAFADDVRNPRYAAVVRDGVELHLQRHDAKEWAHTGDRPAYRFLVADVDGRYREFGEAGVLDNITPVSNTSWGAREFHVRDPDRNGLQFYRAL